MKRALWAMVAALVVACGGCGTSAEPIDRISEDLGGTFVQVNSATPQTAQTVVTAKYNAAQTAGDLNVVVVGWNDITAVVSSVVDTKGNTYALAVGPTRFTPSTLSQSIYYAKNIASAGAAANTVTVTFNVAAAFVDLRVAEYSGMDTSAPLDVVKAASGSSATSDTGTVTTTNANDLLVGANIVNHVTTNPATGYTKRIITSDGDILEDRVVSSVGAYGATAALNTTNNWVMQLAAFKIAGGADAGAERQRVAAVAESGAAASALFAGF